ncbi:hypothetical protein HUK80_14915 [Flavobacterium sp. MAH-1]|uniref:LTXXQ motif family protein n=1 Tax=Flavobacterium agri TaxID=2743471 RepID=A0A7Y8Y427_9FLAO|nr:hypothetical protein [Flavobacterium agri]NUY82194.1 hypothetical protein [Flavobacterium agri]NYA72218.1 hypothetical protein [Flavobacterium agri]
MKMRFALLICLFCVVSASAQIRRNSTGINAIDQQHDMQGSNKGPTPEEQLNTTMQKITADVGLNGLQEAAIRNILKEQMVQLTALRQDSRPESEKMDEARLISEKSDKEIQSLLDPGQLEKYNALKEELRSGKKKKKKKEKDQETVHE